MCLLKERKPVLLSTVVPAQDWLQSWAGSRSSSCAPSDARTGDREGDGSAQESKAELGPRGGSSRLRQARARDHSLSQSGHWTTAAAGSAPHVALALTLTPERTLAPQLVLETL